MQQVIPPQEPARQPTRVAAPEEIPTSTNPAQHFEGLSPRRLPSSLDPGPVIVQFNENDPTHEGFTSVPARHRPPPTRPESQ
jgi:hypothetical protein